MKVTYREALRSKGILIPWKVRNRLLKGRRGATEVGILYLAMIAMAIIIIGVVGHPIMLRILGGVGLDMGNTSDFALFFASWVVVIIVVIALAIVTFVTFEEVALEVLDVERTLLARADEEIEL